MDVLMCLAIIPVTRCQATQELPKLHCIIMGAEEMETRDRNSRRYEFSIEHDGTQYRCERIVTGKRVLRQTIHVAGVGSEEDSVDYGSRGHPPETMADIARCIAYEIVQRKRRE